MIKIIRKINFYTGEPVKILRIQILDKVFFYHITFKRWL